LRGEQLKALAEVTAAEACFLVAAWWMQAARPEGYGWYSKSFMILLGFLGILAHGRPGSYGLKPRSWRFSAKWTAMTVSLFALAYLVALLGAAIAGMHMSLKPVELLEYILWYYVFVGFSEELFFRGYVQSRLNEVFTRRYRSFLWVRFEWTQGTLVTAVFLFGLPHLLVWINPFMGVFRVTGVALAVAASAVFMGLVLGVLREKTGCILLSTALHGSMTFTTFSLSKVIGATALGGVAAAAAVFAFLALLERILSDPLH